LLPALAVGALGTPLKTGLSLGAKILSIDKLAEDGVIDTAVELEGLSVNVIEPPAVELISKVLWEVESTVTVLTACEIVAVSLAII